MTSKHYKWQLRWSQDPAAGTLTHQCGLQVRVIEGRASALNQAEVMPALVAKNGGHNAPQMLARMLREAAQLHAEAQTGGRRHG